MLLNVKVVDKHAPNKGYAPNNIKPHSTGIDTMIHHVRLSVGVCILREKEVWDRKRWVWSPEGWHALG